jgi:uncharacterized protein involved in outer membrane biogenesis
MKHTAFMQFQNYYGRHRIKLILIKGWILMRWKWLVTVGVLLIISLMATGYVILANYDYNKLKPRLVRIVKEATGRELNLGGEIDLAIGFTPTLTVSDVTFANASWGSQPQMVKIKQVQAKVAILPLIFKGMELEYIGFVGVDVFLESDKTGRGNWDFNTEESSAGITGAFKLHNIDIDKIRIEKLNFTFRDGEREQEKRFTLASLEVAKQGAVDSLALDLKADYNGQQLTLAGKIGLIQLLLAHDHFPFELAGKFSNTTVKIDGTINDFLSLQGIDLQARVAGTNLAELELGFGPKLPQTNVFDLTGHLKGSKEALALEDMIGKLSASAVDLAISGSCGDVIALSGMDLHLKGSGQNLAEIGSIIGEKLPATDEFSVVGRLTGSAKTLTMSEASGSAKRDSLNLTLNGKIENLIDLSGVDLKVNGSGVNLAEIGAIIDQKLPATDEFAVEGQLTGSTKALSLYAAQGNAKRGSLNIALSGEVKDVIAFSGLDLQVKGSGKNLTEVGSIVGEKLPATDEFAMQGRLTGSTNALSLQEARGSANRGHLRLTLNGGITNLMAFSGVDLQVNGSGTNLTEISTIIDQKLPATGVFKFQGRLTGSAKELSLKDAQGNVNRGSLNLAVTGQIKNLSALSGMDLKLKGSGKNLAEIGPIIGEALPTTDSFTAQGRLIGSTKTLSLQEAMGSANRDGMSVALDGEITDVLALRDINVRLKASGNELAEIGTLIGSNLPKIGPFDVRGHLVGSTKSLLLNEFSAIVDKSDFKGLAKIEFSKRPKITVQMESSVIDLTPLMRLAEKDKKELGKEEKRPGRLFPDNPLPFDALQKVDADFSVKARNIRMKDAQLEFGHLNLTLAGSNLSIDNFEATYKETKITGNLHIDSGSPPRVATNFLVQNFNLGEFLKETGKRDQVRGIVDIAAHGKSSGDSMSSLMAHLNGSFGAVMGPGYLTKYLDLLSMDLADKVIPFWGHYKKADEINCAGVQFDIKNGDAVSKAFVNSQIGILSVKGNTNLGTEQVNFLLNPRPKDFSLVNLSTKVRVTGTLMNPKVSPDTRSLSKRAAKEVLGFLTLGPLGLLTPFVHLGAHEKHPCDIQGIGQQEQKISTNE